jgi:hypothetical protein
MDTNNCGFVESLSTETAKKAKLEILDKVCFVCGKYCISVMSWIESEMPFIAVLSSGPAVGSAVRSQVL